MGKFPFEKADKLLEECKSIRRRLRKFPEFVPGKRSVEPTIARKATTLLEEFKSILHELTMKLFELKNMRNCRDSQSYGLLEKVYQVEPIIDRIDRFLGFIRNDATQEYGLSSIKRRKSLQEVLKDFNAIVISTWEIVNEDIPELTSRQIKLTRTSTELIESHIRKDGWPNITDIQREIQEREDYQPSADELRDCSEIAKEKGLLLSLSDESVHRLKSDYPTITESDLLVIPPRVFLDWIFRRIEENTNGNWSLRQEEKNKHILEHKCLSLYFEGEYLYDKIFIRLNVWPKITEKRINEAKSKDTLEERQKYIEKRFRFIHAMDRCSARILIWQKDDEKSPNQITQPGSLSFILSRKLYRFNVECIYNFASESSAFFGFGRHFDSLISIIGAIRPFIMTVPDCEILRPEVWRTGPKAPTRGHSWKPHPRGAPRAERK